MHIHKLNNVDAFIAFDCDESELDGLTTSGLVRRAKRILPGGAQDLARSQTYTYAALGMQRLGASAGINSTIIDSGTPDEAIAAFIDEVSPLVTSGAFLPDATKGVTEDDLAPLRENDPRTRIGDFANQCDAITAVAAGEAAVNGLDGITVAIESAIEANPTGADPQTLTDELTERGAQVVIAENAAANNGTGIWHAQVVFAGSKMGVVDHQVVESWIKTCDKPLALVPTGRLAFTAKALATCRKNNIAALPDFVTLCGSTIATWSDPEASEEDVKNTARQTAHALITEALTHPDGAFLASCYKAESFLKTWRTQLPFGRPLAP